MRTLFSYGSLTTLLGPVLLLCLLPGVLCAQVFDEIEVKDGSRIVGDIVDMVDGKLKVKTAFGGGETVVLWSEVTSLKTAKPLPFVLADGTTLVGLADPAGEGKLGIKADAISAPTAVDIKTVTAVNPPPKKAVTIKGSINLGSSLSEGNTNNRAFNVWAELEARADINRVTLRGAYNYADRERVLTERNGKGSIKYDLFLTRRFYLFASALFESDEFQDLNLRTALAGGPGYQFIEKGQFKPNWAKEMELYGEFGVSYFNEDFQNSPDSSYVAGRWGLKFDWPFLPERIAFFHNQEGYPSFENSDDIYISTETGLRFKIWAGFIATAQVNWRWDNTPAPGRERSDTLYLATLGYAFEF